MNHEQNDLAKSSKGYIDGGYKIFFLEDKQDKIIDYHYHTFHKCVIVYSGEVEYLVEDESYHLSENDILWVPSYGVHKVNISSKSVYKRCVIYLSEEFIGLVSEELDKNIDKLGKQFTYSTVLEEQVLKRLLSKFSYDLNEKSQVYCFAQFLLFSERYFTILHQLETEEQTGRYINISENQQIQDAMDYMKENLNKGLKIEEIANHSYLSKHYFMRKFKNTTGLTVHQYILVERLKLARELMRQGVSLTEISYKVGFNNYSTFARAFKKVYNMSPKDYSKMDPRKYDGLHE